jgi:glutathione S-transferase
MSGYKLYGRPGSGSFAVQAILEEARAPYERIWVGRSAADVAVYRDVNPTEKVPALVLPDGTVMFESAAMLIHLAIAHPEADLAPRPGSSAHAHFLQWMVYLSANLYESVLRMYYPARYTVRGEADAEVVRDQATRDYLVQLGLVSRFLGPYVLGQRYSAADPYLHMLASWFPGDRAELDTKLPAVAEHTRLVSARPAVAAVEADHASST